VAGAGGTPARPAYPHDVKFFIPGAGSVGRAEWILAAIKKSAEENTGCVISESRIFRLEYTHEGRDYIAEVGEPEPLTGETTLAILDGDPYLVCTRDRGAERGLPVSVGWEEATKVTFFKDEP
jgi:hypothetical protein